MALRDDADKQTHHANILADGPVLAPYGCERRYCIVTITTTLLNGYVEAPAKFVLGRWHTWITMSLLYRHR